MFHLYPFVFFYLGDDAYNHHDVAVVTTEVLREGHGQGQLGVVNRVVRHQGDRVCGVRLEDHPRVLGGEGYYLTQSKCHFV